MLNTLWQQIQAWVKSKGGWAHAVALVFVAVVGAYRGVPQFAALVNHVYASMPPWLHSLGLVVVALWVWYKRTSSPLGALFYVRQDKALAGVPPVGSGPVVLPEAKESDVGHL